MSSGRLLVASLLFCLAMGCIALAVRGAAAAFAASDGPRPMAEVPASSYVPFGIAMVLLIAGVVVLVSAVLRRR